MCKQYICPQYPLLTFVSVLGPVTGYCCLMYCFNICEMFVSTLSKYMITFLWNLFWRLLGGEIIFYLDFILSKGKADDRQPSLSKWKVIPL